MERISAGNHSQDADRNGPAIAIPGFAISHQSQNGHPAYSAEPSRPLPLPNGQFRTIGCPMMDSAYGVHLMCRMPNLSCLTTSLELSVGQNKINNPMWMQHNVRLARVFTFTPGHHDSSFPPEICCWPEKNAANSSSNNVCHPVLKLRGSTRSFV